jgi:hypothetical protein
MPCESFFVAGAALPKDPSKFAAAFPGDRKLRLESGENLHRSAQACRVRRYFQQASDFFLKTDSGLADESTPQAIDASAGVAGRGPCHGRRSVSSARNLQRRG